MWFKYDFAVLAPLREKGYKGADASWVVHFSVVIICVRESCIEPFKVCEVFNGCLFLSQRREGAKTPRFVGKVFICDVQARCWVSIVRWI